MVDESLVPDQDGGEQEYWRKEDDFDGNMTELSRAMAELYREYASESEITDESKEWEVTYYPVEEDGRETVTVEGHGCDVLARSEGTSTVTIYDEDGHVKMHRLGVREVRRVD